MKIVVFGASGNIGTRLVAELLKRNHDVTACIYGANPFESESRLKVLQVDVHSESDIEKAVTGHDMVISVLGSWGTPTKDILSSGMKHIIPNMKKHGLSRIISLTGADARDVGDAPNIIHKIMHTLIKLLAGKILSDGEAHINLLRSSNLSWTVLRSPVMTNNGKYGAYKLRMTLPYPWATINRKDVVQALANLAESNDYLQQAPIIYRA